jgi:putative ABC transport system permease protein
MNVILAGALSALALGLAVLGIYGVVSFTVLQRTHEIGIRTALGAERGQITCLVLWWGLRLAGTGILLGNLASFWLTSFLAAFLWQIGSLDPPTFMIASLCLVLIALLACYLPARRAARADPLVALRCE